VSELAALIERCDMFLSNDSGPMHVAAALKKPQVAVFTSSSPIFTAPWNNHATVIKTNIDCAPCFKRGCPRTKTRTENFLCYGTINPKDVANAVLQRL